MQRLCACVTRYTQIPIAPCPAPSHPIPSELIARCEVCKDLVGDEVRVQERYGSDINFVMLNIDNTK